MEIEKIGLIIITILAGLALLISGTSDMSGNLLKDATSYYNPAAGLLFLAVFVVVLAFVFRGFFPEHKFK